MRLHCYVCDRMQWSSCMRTHESLECGHAKGTEQATGQATERRRGRSLDRADARPAGDAAEDRACVPGGEAAAACLVRRSVGARPCGYGWAAAVRDRAAHADRAVQHLTSTRS